MKEKQLQVILGEHIKTNRQGETAVYELKICKNKSMPFGQVKRHQINELQRAKYGNLYHKIADQTFGRAGKFGHTLPKPFDCFNIYKAKAYIVIVYYKLRQKKEFIFIDIDKFIVEACNSDRKSLTEERAKEIAKYTIKNK